MSAAIVHSLVTGFLDLVLPPPDRCGLCGCSIRSPTDRADGLCASCRRSYPPFVKYVAHGPRSVLSGRRGFNAVMGAGPYEGRLKEAIWRLKYGGRQDLCHPLGALMARVCGSAMQAWASFDLIVPVPLHPAKEASRGFNQSLLLSKAVGKALGIRVAAGKLRRTRETLPQSALDRKERRDNISGAFSVAERGWFRSRKVLLVDDVFTTGATAFECCSVLMDDGAESTDVLVCAVTGG